MKTRPNPMVSVIVPNYNRQEYLRPCIESILSERLPDCEILVVDDASTDGSLDRIKDLPVRIIKIERNAGKSEAKNRGLDATRGSLVAFLDSDDILSVDGIKWRMELLSQSPSTPVMGFVEEWIDSEGQILPEGRTQLKRAYESIPPILTKDFFENGGEVYAPLGTTLWPKKLLSRVGYFDKTLTHAEDLDYFYRAVRLIPIYTYCRPVYRYRIHGNNAALSMADEKPVIHRKMIASHLMVNLEQKMGPRPNA